MTTGIVESESKPSSSASLTLESWSQGFMIGALIIMAGITLANMRRKVLLHKLIFLELLLAIPNGFFTFFDPPVWGWYLSGTVVPLIASWTLHNIVAWIKCRPFLGPRASTIYIGTVAIAQVYWVLELYANFTFFNGYNETLFTYTRPFEAVCRDPWWIFTTANLFWNIKRRYEFGFVEIVQTSSRLGILLGSMLLSIVFIIVDLLAVTPAMPIGVINPFWKIALVFKCFTDTIILDDFKTTLDKLSRRRRAQILPSDNLAPDTFIHAQELRRSRSQKDENGSFSLHHIEHPMPTGAIAISSDETISTLPKVHSPC